MQTFDSLTPAKLALSAPRLCRWRPRRSAVPNAWRLAEDALQFPLRTRQGEQALDPTTATKQSRMGIVFRCGRDGFVFAIRL